MLDLRIVAGRAGRVWVETIDTFSAFGWDPAHGFAGGAGAGGPTDEGTESNGMPCATRTRR